MTNDAKGVDTAIRILVVIVTYRTAELTISCLRSLLGEIRDDPTIRVTVVDNASGDAPALKEAITANGWEGWVELIIAERNGGFSYGNNRGIEAALRWAKPPEYFLLLNADTEIRGRAVGSLASFLDGHPEVGIAGSSFENPDGSDWPLAFRFPSIASQFEEGVRLGFVTRLLRPYVVAKVMAREPAPTDWVAGASMMIRRRVIDEIGLMDEGYFLYFEEVDYCLAAYRKGWPCWYVPQSRVMHICGQSTGVSSPDRGNRPLPDYWFASRSRYFIKNYGLAYARMADLAYGLGLVLRKLRCYLFGARFPEPKHLMRDFWRTSVLFLGKKAMLRRIGEFDDV